MKSAGLSVLAVAAGLAAFAHGGEAKAAGELTLCWAAWDPANALVELSKDFEKQTSTTMKFEFVPWPNFADRMLNELNSGGKLCDLLIGDSQWLGGSAENGYYVKLNDFFDKEGIKMSDFAPATVYAYSTWPKGTPNYWALPAMGDANGWVYRKDWFSRPDLQAEFKTKTGRDLAPPEDLGRAEGDRRVLPRPGHRRQEGLRRRDLHRARVGRHHHGRDVGALFLRLQIREHAGKYDMQGAVNSPDAVKGLEMYKALYKCCTPPLHGQLHGRGSRRLQVGPGRHDDELVRVLAGMYKDENVGGEHIGFFVNPAEKVAASTLGGQGISVVANTDNMDGALAYIKWFAQPDVQKKWWQLGGYSCHNAVLNDPSFKKASPSRPTS